jgi:uncharacterized protein YqgC (DUF456 family)
MSYVGLLLLLLALVAGWVTTVFSLPGTWLMVAAAALYAWLMPEDLRIALSWTTVGALLALAIVGEIIEFVAGALGVQRYGGSRRGAILAVIGSFFGAIVGAGVGLPIPVVGSIAGVLLGASTGAFVGALLGERWKGRDMDSSLLVGQGAFVGRLLGTVAKIAIASAMVAVTLAGLLIH